MEDIKATGDARGECGWNPGSAWTDVQRNLNSKIIIFLTPPLSLCRGRGRTFSRFLVNWMIWKVPPRGVG
jgi:hypothetical protein